MTQTQREKTTRYQLSQVLQSVRPVVKSLPGYEGQHMSRERVGVCMDEVYPDIFVGDLGSAKNKDYLKRVGITHVLNTAQGDKFANVDTNEEYYKDCGIKFLGLDLMDFPSVDITKYFEVSANFIDSALNSGGRILVHCFMGISRSATITVAFLMIKRGMTAKEGLQQLRKNRSVCPNEGFLSQLADLDNALASKRLQP